MIASAWNGSADTSSDPPLLPLAACASPPMTKSPFPKTPWADGTSHLLVSPLELIEKLTALGIVAVLTDSASIRAYLTGVGPPGSFPTLDRT